MFERFVTIGRMTRSTHRYGSHPSQLGELFLPVGRRAASGRRRRPRRVLARAVRPLADGRGSASTWPRTGWRPGTSSTAASVAAEAGRRRSSTSPRPSMRSTALDAPLDLARVVAVGHSAGGHLAFWAAARPTLARRCARRRARASRIGAAVSQAGVLDLTLAAGLDAVRRRRRRALLGEPTAAVRALRARVAARAAAARHSAARAARRSRRHRLDADRDELRDRRARMPATSASCASSRAPGTSSTSTPARRPGTSRATGSWLRRARRAAEPTKRSSAAGRPRRRAARPSPTTTPSASSAAAAACSGVEIPKPAYSGTSVSARVRSTSGASAGDSSVRAPVVPATVTR